MVDEELTANWMRADKICWLVKLVFHLGFHPDPALQTELLEAKQLLQRKRKERNGLFARWESKRRADWDNLQNRRFMERIPDDQRQKRRAEVESHLEAVNLPQETADRLRTLSDKREFSRLEISSSASTC